MSQVKKPTRKLVVHQPMSPVDGKYTVVQLQNLTNPRVGDELTEEQVRSLINRGVLVTVKAGK